MHTAWIWDGLSHPRRCAGYDYNKEFGDNITHSAARTSQRLRGYTARSPEVKGRTPLAHLSSVTVFRRFGEGILRVEAVRRLS